MIKTVIDILCVLAVFILGYIMTEYNKAEENKS
jgi:hypothetical protein